MSDSAKAEAATADGVLAVATDLIFETLIRTAAEAQGRSYRAARTIAQLQAELSQGTAVLVLVDMEANGLRPEEAIACCKEQRPAPAVIAYYPHVQTRLAEAATTAGADLVLPRSKFHERLGDLLRDHAGARHPTD